MQLRAFVALLATALPAQAPTAPAEPPVATEFRIFDGTVEVTHTAQVRVVRTGPGGALSQVLDTSMASLPAALYDVEVRRPSSSGVMEIRWVRRLGILHYPDQGRRLLQVVNFRPEYGALQLRSPLGRLKPPDVALFRAGDRSRNAGEAHPGADYVLFVVPAGRYDVQVRHPEHGGAPDAHWLLSVEVPPGATRLKVVPDPR